MYHLLEIEKVHLVSCGLCIRIIYSTQELWYTIDWKVSIVLNSYESPFICASSCLHVGSDERLTRRYTYIHLYNRHTDYYMVSVLQSMRNQTRFLRYLPRHSHCLHESLAHGSSRPWIHVYFPSDIRMWWCHRRTYRHCDQHSNS